MQAAITMRQRVDHTADIYRVDCNRRTDVRVHCVLTERIDAREHVITDASVNLTHGCLWVTMLLFRHASGFAPWPADGHHHRSVKSCRLHVDKV